jgi:DGQHR domain-containing protein
MGLETEALKVSQRGMALYITVFSASELLAHARVDYWQPTNPGGYQRPLQERRLKEVADYLCYEVGVLPTSILLSMREQSLEFDPQREAGRAGQWGTLRISEDTVLWVVDGQHRLYGLEHALKEKRGDWVGDYPVPVTIVEGIDRYAEMSLFNIVNTRQKPVPTDIVDQHLSRMVKEEGADFIPTKGMNAYKRGRAASIVGLLNQLDGPWHNKVKVPGVAGMDIGIIRYHSLVASLMPVLDDAWLSARSDTDISYLLANYWAGLRNMMPLAFQSPLDYRLQATVGVYALHMLFARVVRLCATAGDFSAATMERILRYTSMTSMFWHREHGDWQTKATDMASIRRLAEYLRLRLPHPGRLA